jgi:hypothetical protein
MCAEAMLSVVPLDLDEARAIVALWHRHLSPPIGGKFAIGAVKNGVIVGAAVVGRPVGRGSDRRRVTEVTRCATNGTHNACSLLYGAAARAAKAMGYDKIQTYNLDAEGGPSLRAAGYVRVADIQGREWKRSDGAPRANENTDDKGRWERVLRLPAPIYVFPDMPFVPQQTLEIA